MILTLIPTACLGITEQRDMIAVIDTGIGRNQSKTGIMCSDGKQSFVNDWGFDNHGHGRNIIGIISKQLNPKTQCIISYKVYVESINGEEATSNIINSINDAVRRGVKYINISMGGSASSKREIAAIKNAIKHKVYVTVAAGNDGNNFDRVGCNYFPACYREFIKSKFFNVVTSLTLSGSNRGKVINRKERGRNVKGGGVVLSGTSQSSAVFTGKLISGKVK